MPHINSFWSGVIVAPVPWLIVLAIAGFSFRQLRAIKEYYVGLPCTQWLGMFLIVLGCKVVKSGKHCHFMPYNGRSWISPNVSGFEIPKEKD